MYHRGAYSNVQVNQIIPGQKESCDLIRGGGQRHGGTVGSVEILVLMVIEEGGFVGVFLGDSGVYQVEHID